MQYNLKTLARRLKERRAELGLSLEDVSDEIDCTVSTISTWETGIRQPRAGGLFWISKFYDVSVDWLLGLSDKKKISQRTGRWKHVEIESDKSDAGYFLLPQCECSVCELYVEQESNYCPHCGAKMEVKKE